MLSTTVGHCDTDGGGVRTAVEETDADLLSDGSRDAVGDTDADLLSDGCRDAVGDADGCRDEVGDTDADLLSIGSRDAVGDTDADLLSIGCRDAVGDADGCRDAVGDTDADLLSIGSRDAVGDTAADLLADCSAVGVKEVAHGAAVDGRDIARVPEHLQKGDARAKRESEGNERQEKRPCEHDRGGGRLRCCPDYIYLVHYEFLLLRAAPSGSVSPCVLAPSATSQPSRPSMQTLPSRSLTVLSPTASLTRSPAHWTYSNQLLPHLPPQHGTGRGKTACPRPLALSPF